MQLISCILTCLALYGTWLNAHARREGFWYWIVTDVAFNGRSALHPTHKWMGFTASMITPLFRPNLGCHMKVSRKSTGVDDGSCEWLSHAIESMEKVDFLYKTLKNSIYEYKQMEEFKNEEF